MSHRVKRDEQGSCQSVYPGLSLQGLTNSQVPLRVERRVTEWKCEWEVVNQEQK
jgi:hypothetical protein